MNTSNKIIVIYDSECVLCRRFRAGVERALTKDGPVFFSSVHDDRTYNNHPYLLKDECLKTLHVITPDQKVLTGGSAVEFLALNTPALKPLLWLLNEKSTKAVSDFFYKTSEGIRQKLSKRRERLCCQNIS